MIKLHAGQSEVFENLFIDKSQLFSVVCCARGWGKSYLAAAAAVTAVYELMDMSLKIPNKHVYVVAPTYDQVTDIYFPVLAYDFGLEEVATKSSRDKGRFVFPNRVELRLVSYEAVERMRGKGAYFVVWDEVSSCKKGLEPREAWEDVIQPCIKTRWSKERSSYYNAPSPGRALIISTPKGYNFFYDMYNFRETNKEWGSYHYDYKSSPFLSPEEIEAFRHNMDPIAFATEYLASFKESGNNVFYCFDRNLHVRQDIDDFQVDGTNAETVYACIDFNVGLQCTSFFALRGKQMQFIDETQGHPDTENLAIYIKNRFSKHKVIAFPDPTGKSRKSSAPVGQTDFSILRSKGIEVLARDGSPPIVDSVASVNRLLKTAAGETNLFVHPRCKGLIKSLERTKWVDGKPDSAMIDKTESLEHFSDGVRYAAEYMFPIRNGQKVTHRGFNF